MLHLNLGKIIDNSTDYGRPERKQPSLHGLKFNPNPKFLGTAEAYFVCHIGPIFQISLIYAFIGCPQSVLQTVHHTTDIVPRKSNNHQERGSFINYVIKIGCCLIQAKRRCIAVFSIIKGDNFHNWRKNVRFHVYVEGLYVCLIWNYFMIYPCRNFT